jgi:hypothetical protein
MAKVKNDIATRVAERLKIVQEGCTVSSADLVTINSAIEDAYAALKFELRLTWDLTAIPDESVLGLVICASALAASGTNAPDAGEHEAKYDYGERQLRVVNRIRPDNSKPVEQVAF